MAELSMVIMQVPGLWYPGCLCVQILVALLEVVRRNALGTAAFGTFGSFWLSAGLYSILQAQGVFFLQVHKLRAGRGRGTRGAATTLC